MIGRGSIPAPATLLLDAFLRAAGDGAAGAALHALLAADAPLFRDARWRRADEEDAAVFAAAHQALSARGADALPQFRAAAALRWQPEALGETAVLWFSAEEACSARAVVGALGVRAGALGLRVAWATLAEREETWSFATGRAQTLAQFAWMALRAPATARTTLDAAWFRLYWRPAGDLESLPGTRFACHSTASCCRQDYVVAVPEAAQALVDALPWERLAPRLAGTRLAPFDAGRVEIKGREEACRFLGPRQECLIHAALGYQPFAPCAAFPFSFAATPTGVAVTASLSCDSVCAARGPTLPERDADLRARLAIAPLRTTESYRLAPDVPVAGALFQAAEAQLRALLGRQELPLYRRLHLGVRALEALGAGRDLWLSAGLDAPVAPLAPIEPALRAQIGALLDRIQRWDRRALRDLPRSVPRDLRHQDLIDAPRLVAELQALHFSRIYAYEFDLTTAHNLAIILYLLALAWQRHFAPAGLDALRARELTLLGSHGLLRSLLVPPPQPAFRALLGSTQFGDWALAFAEA